MVQSTLLSKLEALPESLQTEVLHYVEFLAERYAKVEANDLVSKKKRGALGSLKGKIWMADDFDAPLEDLKEYM
jgi:hypothetical protein